MKRLASLAGAIGVVGLVSSTAGAGVIDPALADVLAEADPDTVVSTLVYLADRVDTTTMTDELDAQGARLIERHEIVVRALQDKAAATQGDLTAHLAALEADNRIDRFKAWWIGNIIRVDAVPAEIDAIAARGDVDRVYLNHPIEAIHPVEGEPGAHVPVGGAEPGLVAIRAPEVWAMGIDGTGVLVSTLDTGVDGSHPALASRWRGLDAAYLGNPEWAFFDPVTNWTFPQDSGSHGTHTMGSVCGGAPGDQIGVAPGAEWIHAAVIDRVSIAQTISDAIDAFQWTVDPDGNPGTVFDVPATSSNSWGLADVHGVPDCDQTFWSFIDACEAAGVVVIFAAGNEGSSSNTLRRPADRATDEYRTFAVAAVDGNDPGWPIAGFSSRGPTDCGPNGESATKPDISGPGVSVRSSFPGGGYGTLSGTSMSTPHLNGVVALMRQANPDLSPDQIKQIIYDTAVDLGSPGEDNSYGWGMVDAFEAVGAALSQATLSFSFPDGHPDFMDPNGGTTIPVIVSGQANTPVPGSGTLYYSTGGPFTEVAMNEVLPNEYEAVFPAFACGATVTYYFSADADSGDTIFSPFSAPDTTYAADAYTGLFIEFRDTFNTDTGWTVEDDAGLTSGTWERGEPLGGGDRGDPANDADGSTKCYVTGIADGDNDIDGGATTLTSPIMDATDPALSLSYYRWYSNATGADPENDIFVVDVSDDGGANWTNLETVGPSGPGVNGGWIYKQFLVADIPGITNTSQLRVRFTASDLSNPSVVEAGVDAVELSSLFCDEGTCPDADGDGEVGINDFLLVIGNWGPNPGHPADLDGDGEVGINDFLLVLGSWGPC